eukprot:m.1366218 g.1366218  ORF g.1366218 m.1366218 type:complete len:433 (-) comp24951_c0_seq14:3690-4988(-)
MNRIKIFLAPQGYGTIQKLRGAYHCYLECCRLVPRTRRLLTSHTTSNLRCAAHNDIPMIKCLRCDISSGILRRFFSDGSLPTVPPRAGVKNDPADTLNVVDFDEFGLPQLKSIPKRELRHAFDLSRRFLKILDGSMVNRHPLITVNSQGSAIIVSLDHTARVIILRDRVVLPDPRTTAGERLCVLLKRSLERSPQDPSAFNLIDGSLTDESNRYELRALDAVLKFVAGGLEHQFRVLAGAVNTVLRDLSQGASDEALQRLIPLKLALSAFGVQVKEFKEAVDDVVDNPKSLYKLDLSTRDPTDAAPHDDGANESAVETAHNLLDHYYYIADEIYNETEQLIQDIRGTEEVLAISLDKSRNQLINLNLFATAGLCVWMRLDVLTGMIKFRSNMSVVVFVCVSLLVPFSTRSPKLFASFSKPDAAVSQADVGQR